MVKKLLFPVLAGAMLLCLPIAVAQALDHWPTELVYYDTGKDAAGNPMAYTGVTLYTPISWPVDIVDTSPTYGHLTGGKAYTYMLDMYGCLVHYWPSAPETPYPIWQAQLLEPHGSAGDPDYVAPGSILRCSTMPDALTVVNGTAVRNFPELNGGGAAGLLEQVSWNGNVVRAWNAYSTYTSPTDSIPRWFRQHHDMKMIYNKALGQNTIIFIAWEGYQTSEAQAKGWPVLEATGWWSPDGIYEMDMQGNIIWKWSFYDHFTTGKEPGKMNVTMFNTFCQGILTMDYNHIDSLDYHPDLGYIVMNSRNSNEFYVIDHDATFVAGNPTLSVRNAATSTGDFLYRFGAPMNYIDPSLPDRDTVDRPSWGANGTVQIWGASCIQWIPQYFYTNGPLMTVPNGQAAGNAGVVEDGYNFLIFDNHCSNNNPLGGGSHVLEIDPTIMSRRVSGGVTAYTRTIDDGAKFTASSYVLPPNAGYFAQLTVGAGLGYGKTRKSNQIVWDYTGNHASTLNSSHNGSAQRLPNGNTLICSGEIGHFMEVKYDGTLVWEFVNPVYNGTPVKSFINPITTTLNQVFRGYRWDTRHPGIKSKVTEYADGRILPEDPRPGRGRNHPVRLGVLP